MSAAGTRVLLCTCNKTMALDAGRILAEDGLAAPVCSQLCRSELDIFEGALAEGTDLLVACTQEAPLFQEIADETPGAPALAFVNIRETAGWTGKDDDPNPKIAALIAEARKPVRPTPVKPIASDGLCLVYGHGQEALEAALALEGALSVTLVLKSWDDLVLPSVLPVPVHCGTLKSLKGSFGGFDVVIDGYAPMMPSSRGAAEFLMPRDGAASNCSLVLDLSGDTAPITAPHRRDGYFRIAPADRAKLAETLLDIADMAGDFEKPLYVTYEPDICAHGYAGKTGCSKCLDACPAGAISSLGDKIEIDNGICGGCGSCAAHCPTGAVSYQHPAPPDLLGRIQTLLGTYRSTGGGQPILLVHDSTKGMELIGALARFGDGLPGHVLPLALHSVTAFGHDAMMTALAAGAEHVLLLANPEIRDELPALEAEAALSNSLASGLSAKEIEPVSILCEADPDAVATALKQIKPAMLVKEPKTFATVGGKRDMARMAIGSLKAALPAAPDMIDLPEGAPYGRIAIATEGCTMCLSCVSACPAGALADNPDRPQISFVEAACVQCGLCQTTCPENVISLEPRYNLAPGAMTGSILHEEEPALCTGCGKPFGTRSTIERIKERLAGKHQMFRSEEQARLIGMCDDCRINTQWNMDESVFRAGDRPRIRTTDDYVQADKSGLSVEDFLKGN